MVRSIYLLLSILSFGFIHGACQRKQVNPEDKSLIDFLHVLKDSGELAAFQRMIRHESIDDKECLLALRKLREELRYVDVSHLDSIQAHRFPETQLTRTTLYLKKKRDSITYPIAVNFILFNDSIHHPISVTHEMLYDVPSILD